MHAASPEQEGAQQCKDGVADGPRREEDLYETPHDHGQEAAPQHGSWGKEGTARQGTVDWLMQQHSRLSRLAQRKSALQTAAGSAPMNEKSTPRLVAWKA